MDKKSIKTCFALWAADLDWILERGYSSGGYFLGCSQSDHISCLTGDLNWPSRESDHISCRTVGHNWPFRYLDFPVYYFGINLIHVKLLFNTFE